MAKIGRNQRCPCGSGKKYKHCHGRPSDQNSADPTRLAPDILREMHRRVKALDKRRELEQGFGRPIVSGDFQGHKFVAVGNTIHHSPKWKYFTDFLHEYLVTKFGREWGAAELKKPEKEQHPVVRWNQLVVKLIQSTPSDPDGGKVTKQNGLFVCYMGLAYNLYLLEHNAELQTRYIERLKDIKQFQGAYYELIVASCFIRGGFELRLEDETDPLQKHCEFSAVSKRTGKKFWVEAKMRSVAGHLGKTNVDGQPPTSKPTSRLSVHLNGALAKPADDDRIIFIDVNAEPMTAEAFNSVPPKIPKWLEAAENQLSDRENNLKEGEEAFVFVTNFYFHKALDSEFLGQAFMKFGLGKEDYGRSGAVRMIDAWIAEQKYADLFVLEDSMGSYPQIPNHFSADLPPVGEGDRERIIIGETYYFTDAGIEGKVQDALVSESDKRIYVVVNKDGASHLLSEEISDRELEIYRRNKDTYFGVVRPVPTNKDKPYDLFKWMVDTYRHTPKEKLLEFMKEEANIDELTKLDQLELALIYCENMVSNIVNSRSLKP